MSRVKRILATILVVMVSVGLLATTAMAASYPKKPINVMQGFKPGGGSDALAQLTQPFLEKAIGTTFVNQYIPGATGAIAWTQLAKTTRNDGYTISITNTPMLMTNYIMNKEISYNINELTPIANVVTDPGIVVVSKDSPYKTAQEFFDAARKNPGKITVGNSGIGGDDFFTTLIVEKASGLKFQMIPFQGDGPSWQAAMGGKIDASFNNLGITFPQIKAGNLRPLVLFAEERNPNIPDVPTLKELGYDVVSGSSRGYSAPKGIPAEAQEALIKAFKAMGDNPDFHKTAEERALTLDLKYGPDYEAYLQKQEKMFGEIWNEVKDQYTH
ncbi:Bug family tripartite tricarboxylate transporter substrate binding protein [Pelobacter seleniigenes]|uniref:Bug family tripartite tricarboxylate transporter substrate binding protein n=1 Tax=Pelobacter seleniigenes TaxID=407188 RepID=UPI0004A6BA45|nr:tripartite tricarboxylate transporter substrate binding protein [Pelobacter seleniigenes]